MYFLYILESLKNKRIYTGITSDLVKRLNEHNNGNNISTKAYRPWKIIFSEEYDSKAKAAKREKYLKSGKGREYIKKLLNR